MSAIFLTLLASLPTSQEPQTSGPEALRVGLMVEVRGALDEHGTFVVEKVELLEPGEDDVLIGLVPEDQTDALHFTLLGQPVETDVDTRWQDIERGSLAGKRVKVSGSWKGPRKFRADSIAARGTGRDRIAGRLDELVPVEGGWRGRILIFTVFVPARVEVEHELPLERYTPLPQRETGQKSDIERDEDDQFGKGFALTDTLRLSGQLELKSSTESNYDLNDDSEEDRTDYDYSIRERLTWTPGEDLAGMLELRYSGRYRRDEDNGQNDSENSHSGAFGETWLQWRDVSGREGLDLTVGRQDFDEPREWIYDQNLDAVRVSWIRPDWRLDVSASTLISGGSERDENSTNGILYLSNNDEDKHLALWGVYRDIGDFNADNGFVPDETSLHVGVRALGEWLPQNEVWADFAYQTADRPQFDAGGTSLGVDEDVSAWGYDVGTTWRPEFADPIYVALGYAFGSGNGTDGTFRQTGFHDNTSRFGGVTSFVYYGELLDPELSNLGITTLAVGARVAERTSIDLVFHTYTQDEARAEFSPLPQRDAQLKQRPNGIDGDLGWEADLVFGWPRLTNVDVEIVGATFEPDDGFTNQDRAYFLKLQVRYRM